MPGDSGRQRAIERMHLTWPIGAHSRLIWITGVPLGVAPQFDGTAMRRAVTGSAGES